MRNRGLVFGVMVALVVALGAAAVAQQNYTDPGLVPTGPFPTQNDFQRLGTLTFYPNRATFETAWPGLPMEDFTGTSVGNGGITACDPPLNSATNDACFTTGSVIDGFSLGVTVDTGGGMYVTINNVFVPCVNVGPNSFSDEADWNFSPAAAAVGMDLYTPLGGGETFGVEVFGPGGSLGSTNIVAGGTSAVFVGVDTTDAGGITRIEFREAVDGTGELFCDLEFGGAPVPVTLQSADVE
jgi:hypothetical protein